MAPIFREWLTAVAPRFPEFQDLSEFVRNSTEWPDGFDEIKLIALLQRSGRQDLIPSLSRALSTFDLLCVPSAPMPDEMRLPWDWHTPRLVEQTKASMKRRSRDQHVSTAKYR